MSSPNLLDKFLTDAKASKARSTKQEIMDSESQAERLSAQQWKNPYEVLLLNFDCSEEDIKRHYKLFTMSLHPDKCDHPKAKEAFAVVSQAYKTLMDPDKRRIYQRIMKEAWNKTVFERSQKNKERKAKGLPLLPEDTFYHDYKINCRRLFQEIDDKKAHLFKMDEMSRLKKNQELEIMALKEHYKILTEEEWDKTRSDRVNKWQNFKKKANKIGSKTSDGSIRPVNKEFDKVKRF